MTWFHAKGAKKTHAKGAKKNLGVYLNVWLEVCHQPLFLLINTDRYCL